MPLPVQSQPRPRPPRTVSRTTFEGAQATISSLRNLLFLFHKGDLRPVQLPTSIYPSITLVALQASKHPISPPQNEHYPTFFIHHNPKSARTRVYIYIYKRPATTYIMYILVRWKTFTCNRRRRRWSVSDQRNKLWIIMRMMGATMEGERIRHRVDRTNSEETKKKKEKRHWGCCCALHFLINWYQSINQQGHRP